MLASDDVIPNVPWWKSPIFWMVALLCALAFGWMEYLAINQWLRGKWFLADVGNIQYCLVNTWTGKFMYSQLDGGNFFASHFSPFLLLVLPIVWLSDFPIPLVTSYQLALALTPVPIMILARQRNLTSIVGVALGLWFLCNHFVGSLELSNHFEAYYVLLALCAMAALRSPNRYAWWILAILAISVKEDCAVWMLGYFAWEWVFHRKEQFIRRRAARGAILCVGWGLAAGAVLYLMGINAEFNSAKYVERMGGISVGRDNAMVLVALVASAGGLCLVNWRAALLLLIPVPMLLGNFEFTRNLLYYYSYPFLPVLALATVSGAAKFVEIAGEQGRKWVAVAIMTILLAVSAWQAQMPTRTEGIRRVPEKESPRDAARRLVARTLLPRNVPVAIGFNLWGDVPWRTNTVWLKPGQFNDSHYVFVDRYGVHGLAPEDYDKLRQISEADMESGRRKILRDAYDFVVMAPATNVSDGDTTAVSQ